LGGSRSDGWDGGGRLKQPEDATADEIGRRKALLAQKMVLVLPGFGRWASKIRDFETPYGSAGIRQLEVLYALRHALLDPNTPVATALADKFQIQHSVVTRILKKLEAAGYISREPDPRDGRAWQIAITETGRKLSDYVEAEYFKEMEAALGEPDEGGLACLERAIELLMGVGRNLGMGDFGRLVGRSADR
jgi:DNA-binding MarR family transcriptional regulator